MIDKPGRRRTGVVRCQPGTYRTLGSGHLSSERYQSIDVPQIVPADRHLLTTLCIPLRLLFSDLDWDEWGIEIVEGHDRLVEILEDESTCLIDQRALADRSLLGWELLHAFFSSSLYTQHARHLQPDEIDRLAFTAQIAWFAHERQSWQMQLLQSLQTYAQNASELIKILWHVLSPARASVLGQILDPNPSDDPLYQPSGSFLAQESDIPTFWKLASTLPSLCPKNPSVGSSQEEIQVAPTASFAERWRRFQRSFAICSPLPWAAFSGPVLGILFRYFHEIDPSTNSTHRRLSLFRLVSEQQQELDEPFWRLAGSDWLQISTLILDPQKHPRISCALLQFLETTQERMQHVLWPINNDEYLLAQLSSQNRLSEEDDRFFRQATHLQAIWRDILHRNTSQDWASSLLFDALERITCRLRAEPELIFLALISNRSMWEHSTPSQNGLLRNLRELLWILSQSPLTVLRRLFPRDLAEHEKAQQRWPMLRRYLRRFLHLAPPILSRLLDQLDEVTATPSPATHQERHFHVDADSDIQEQELHGRILPLLARPELRDQHQIRLEQVDTLRIVCLDKHLTQSSGLWKSTRFFRCFLLFFKTKQNIHEGHWFHLALWLDKEIDLLKLSQQKGDLPSSVNILLQEEGIWEPTYRYQFLTVDQLMYRLKTHNKQWANVLHLLGEEYEDLLLLRLREMLDYHFYLYRFQHPLQTVGEDTASSLWNLSLETFEVLKTAWTREIVQLILAEFYRMHLHDSCSWLAAEQNINLILQEILDLCTLAPEELLRPPVDASLVHRSVANILQTWQDVHASTEPLPRQEMEDAWKSDKCSLLQRLATSHSTQAMFWLKHFIRQFERDYKLVELILPSPLEESGVVPLFKPLGTLYAARPENPREMAPFLRDTSGYLMSPLFLQTLSQIPISLLRQALEQSPDLFPAIQRAAKLLQELDRDGEQHLQFWNTLEDLRQLSLSAQQSSKKQLSNETQRPEGSSSLD